MTFPNLTTAIAVIVSTLAVYAALSNALLVLFRAVGWTRAAQITLRIGGFIVFGLHVALDVAQHPNIDGARAAMADLDELGEREPVAVVAAARFRAFARLLGVTLVLALLFVLAGCGAVEPVVHLVQVEGRLVTAAEPCLVSAYHAEQQACVDDSKTPEACVAEVRTRWKPVIEALAEEHDARCTIEPAKCPAVKP